MILKNPRKSGFFDAENLLTLMYIFGGVSLECDILKTVWSKLVVLTGIE